MGQPDFPIAEQIIKNAINQAQQMHQAQEQAPQELIAVVAVDPVTHEETVVVEQGSFLGDSLSFIGHHPAQAGGTFLLAGVGLMVIFRQKIGNFMRWIMKQEKS